MAGFRADRLRLVREFRGLSQNELASRSGVDVSRINRYEKGAAEPSSRLLGQLADALDFTADFLLGRDNFDGLPIRELAARESFELFGRRASVAETDRERLRRMIPHERAPKTVDEWIAIHELTATQKKRAAHSASPAAVQPSVKSRRHKLKAVPKKRS
jgi:transcriptional regulator with XRE-family HTH domain